MLRTAVVGCGYWGPNIIRNLMEIPEVELVTICDRDTDRLKSIQARHPNLECGNSFDAVLQRPDVEAVVLVTPADTHAELGRACLESGKHTFVEKPLALNTLDCRELIYLAEDNDLTLMVGHTFLYNDAVRQLRSLIDEGELGDVWYLHARRLNLGQIRQDVNAMWNLSPHDISILLYLLEEQPARVLAKGYKFLGQDTEDLVTLTLEFPSGRVGFIEASWLSPNKVRDVTVVGSRKMAVYNDVSSDAKLTLYDKGVENTQDGTSNYGEFQYRLRFGDIHIPHLRIREPLRMELEHFVECIQTGSRPLTDGHNGLQTVEVLEAAQRSLNQGGVPIELRPPIRLAA